MTVGEYLKTFDGLDPSLELWRVSGVVSAWPYSPPVYAAKTIYRVREDDGSDWWVQTPPDPESGDTVVETRVVALQEC